VETGAIPEKYPKTKAESNTKPDYAQTALKEERREKEEQNSGKDCIQ
jgi:hypothetical protein